MEGCARAFASRYSFNDNKQEVTNATKKHDTDT